MSKRDKGKGAVPKVTAENVRYQRWVSRAYGFAGACLFALALTEAFDWATPLNRTLLMLGIGAAGTVAWVMQAKRVCPGCGHPYGYAIRLVNVNVCNKCRTEFPPWRPGMEDDSGQK